ncbi:MAG TPA: N-methyl-L-tryptophan oxidase [Pyrinomonadaceae bacterium]|nr:N-methyl-L-tryptophan oxidase [Pyrinomonadaceae bacterium]
MNSDVIVIGLGAMGSAACYQLAKRGVKVIGIDRYSPPHTLGSTHGETRVTRLAIGEGEHFVPFALRSHEIWRELESETGDDLLTITGGLIMSSASEPSFHGSSNFLQTTIDAAQKFGIKHRVLNAGEITDEFPQFILSDNERGYFEDEAGFVRPESCVAAQLKQAEKNGAMLRRNERVLRVEKPGDGVSVVTDRGNYSAAKAIVSAGPWVNELVDGIPSDRFKIYRQVFFWFDISAAHEDYSADSFPIFIWSTGSGPTDFFYGIPAVAGPGGGLKLATEEFEATTTPEYAERDVSGEESRRMFDTYVSGRLRGVGERCVRSAVCLYTTTSDCNFVIDWADENIFLASPCSGHGFKHSAAIGETLAELALTGTSTIDVSPFSIKVR